MRRFWEKLLTDMLANWQAYWHTDTLQVAV